MNKLAIALVLISMGGMGLFAEGNQEETKVESETGYMGRGYSTDDQEYRGRGWAGASSLPANATRGQMPMQRPMKGAPGYADNETLTFTGTIDLTDVNAPKLTVGEESYELMVPYRLDYDIDIADGDEITISGFEVPAYRRTADADSTNLMVTGATFDGKEYDLNIMDEGPMANRRGPASGQKGRPGRNNNGGIQNNSNQRSERK